jgi:hypothetical protein
MHSDPAKAGLIIHSASSNGWAEKFPDPSDNYKSGWHRGVDMQNMKDKDQWVWVVIQDPGGLEQFLGQLDQQENISFIPAFSSKEAAEQCFLNLTRQPGHKYEVQAILREELLKDAAAGGFIVFLLAENGEVLEKIKP